MLITRADLQQVRSGSRLFRAYSLNEAIANSRRGSPAEGVSIFLSHKHDELQDLMDAIDLFKSVGVSVYVDWMDESMPSTTSGDTASKIKKRIDQNRKFVLLATQGAIGSKWCNWELGYGDARKFSKDMAVMPVADSTGSWPGNEYLQIYPSIQKESDFAGGWRYYVQHGTSKVSLADWLRS